MHINWLRLCIWIHINVQSGDTAQGQKTIGLAEAPHPPHVSEPKRVRLAPDVGLAVPNFRGKRSVGLQEPLWLAETI